ncbi:hypothetical protein NQ314_013968 [Rhamnusium bicolor]|uniref:PiggyBac transposable element-derived protein domain-containing protein n=1 Tax=Rhamnusium bicolor TaxID=1586634 RepID=A0AAV8X4H3_9CUCU|nr:hypothetical protein NQ314_013968 [Rhamnusium bicolor]
MQLALSMIQKMFQTGRKYLQVQKNFPFLTINELLVPIPGNNEPLDYFRMIFDDDILKLLVNETNQYAEDIFCSQGITGKSRITRWQPVTCDEMLKFIALVLHTGTIKMNRLQDYWKSHPLYNMKCFSAFMSRDRFLIILQCLHFARKPVYGENSTDLLYKIRPLLNFFNNKMAEIYYPGKELSLNESMVLWRGRLIFWQYIKNKRHKYGIKLYMLKKPSGIIIKSLVYTGALQDGSGKGHTTRVVLDLLEGCLDSGHSIYMDNFYNSYELARQLTIRGTYCTGTLNFKRRHNPKDVLTKKLKKGESIARYSDDIMVAKWKNKRDVLYISTEHRNEMVQFVDKRNRSIEKPATILHYNRHMGGIDRQDQMTSYYPASRKTIRWYKKLGIHYIQLMLLNSFFLYRKFSGHKMSLYYIIINLEIHFYAVFYRYQQPKRKGCLKEEMSQTMS